MRGADVLMVLDRLEEAGLVVWLDGGWGVDALLGLQSRPHQDLDLAIARDDLPVAQAALAAVGFERDRAAVPGPPARVLLADGHGRQVDLHLLVFDGQGNGWQEVGEDTWGAYPAEDLAATGVVEGRRVRCTSARLQVRHHLGYPLRDADRRDLRLLAERFGVAVPPTARFRDERG